MPIEWGVVVAGAVVKLVVQKTGKVILSKLGSKDLFEENLKAVVAQAYEQFQKSLEDSLFVHSEAAESFKELAA